MDVNSDVRGNLMAEFTAPNSAQATPGGKASPAYHHDTEVKFAEHKIIPDGEDTMLIMTTEMGVAAPAREPEAIGTRTDTV